MIIQLSNKDDSIVYPPVTSFQDLSIDTELNLGYSLASWTMKRDALRSYDDLKPYVQVKIMDDGEIVWEGYIDEPRHKGYEFRITCLGWASILGTTGVRVDQPSQKCSTFINSTVLADADVSAFLSAGTIQTGDYTCPILDDIRPWKYYSEVLGEYLKWNDWRLNVWEKKRVFWEPKQTTIKWVVRASDCKDFEITQSPQNYWNVVPYSYTQTDTQVYIDQTGLTASQTQWGRKVYRALDIPGVVTPTQAADIADKFLYDGATMTVVGDLNTAKVYEYPSFIPVTKLWRVKAGDPVLVVEYLPGDAGIGDTVNEITSFEIRGTSYNHKEKRIVIAPKEWNSSIDVTLARLEAKAK